MVRNKRKQYVFCEVIAITRLDHQPLYGKGARASQTRDSGFTQKSSGVIGLRLTLVEQGDFEQLCKLFNIYFKLYS